MSFKKYSSLLVCVMLMVIAKPARPAAIDEFEAPEEGKRSEAQMYYELIPVEKRGSFIRYYLAEGLMKDGMHLAIPFGSVTDDYELEFGSPPPNFARNLLAWTKETFDLEDEHVEDIVKSSKRVCIPAKGCFDPDYIGDHCCIF